MALENQKISGVDISLTELLKDTTSLPNGYETKDRQPFSDLASKRLMTIVHQAEINEDGNFNQETLDSVKTELSALRDFVKDPANNTPKNAQLMFELKDSIKIAFGVPKGVYNDFGNDVLMDSLSTDKDMAKDLFTFMLDNNTSVSPEGRKVMDMDIAGLVYSGAGLNFGGDGASLIKSPLIKELMMSDEVKKMTEPFVPDISIDDINGFNSNELYLSTLNECLEGAMGLDKDSQDFKNIADKIDSDQSLKEFIYGLSSQDPEMYAKVVDVFDDPKLNFSPEKIKLGQERLKEITGQLDDLMENNSDDTTAYNNAIKGLMNNEDALNAMKQINRDNPEKYEEMIDKYSKIENTSGDEPHYDLSESLRKRTTSEPDLSSELDISSKIVEKVLNGGKDINSLSFFLPEIKKHLEKNLEPEVYDDAMKGINMINKKLSEASEGLDPKEQKQKDKIKDFIKNSDIEFYSIDDLDSRLKKGAEEHAATIEQNYKDVKEKDLEQKKYEKDKSELEQQYIIQERWDQELIKNGMLIEHGMNKFTKKHFLSDEIKNYKPHLVDLYATETMGFGENQEKIKTRKICHFNKFSSKLVMDTDSVSRISDCRAGLILLNKESPTKQGEIPELHIGWSGDKALGAQYVTNMIEAALDFDPPYDIENIGVPKQYIAIKESYKNRERATLSSNDINQDENDLEANSLERDDLEQAQKGASPLDTTSEDSTKNKNTSKNNDTITPSDIDMDESPETEVLDDVEEKQSNNLNLSSEDKNSYQEDEYENNKNNLKESLKLESETPERKGNTKTQKRGVSFKNK